MTGYLGTTVTKQFSNSPTLLALLESVDEWCDLEKFSDDFLANVWDITQAQGFGLDIWGRILGQSRYLAITPTPNANFGFDTDGAPGTNWKPWGSGTFWGGSRGGSVPYALPDPYYRQLLLVKAAANIATCDPPSINALLRAMYGDRGPCWVSYDINTPMALTYHFGFFPTPVDISITQSGVFPLPAAMNVLYAYASLSYTPFGFAGMNAGINPRAVAGWSVPGTAFYQPLAGDGR